MLSPGQSSNQSGSGLRRWLPWLLLGVALLALSFLGDASFDGWIDRANTKPLRPYARFISRLGDWPALVIGAALAGIVGVVVHRRCWRIVCTMVLAASIAGLTANVFRCATGRTRPHAELSQGWYGPQLGKHLRLAKHALNSFPSAHTTTAMAYFVALLILAPRIGIWLMPAPLLVGASRLCLEVHHLSDVCAGLLLGTAVAIFSCRVLAPRWPEFVHWVRTQPLRKFQLSEKVVG